MKKIVISSNKDLPSYLLPDRKISADIEEKVSKIISTVRVKGDSALIFYTKKFDKIKLTSSSIKISKEKLRNCWDSTPAHIKNALKMAACNIKKCHSKQIPQAWTYNLSKGKTVGQLFRPIERIGVYIPGGTAPLISTVLMTVLPAKIAGVKEIVLVTPPPANKFILSAAYFAGAAEVYQSGGAQAIAALAYGTKTIKKVAKIFGPGNIYVTCAKKLVYGDVAIDMLAGPSDILILSDDSANVSYIAGDLLSQLEHDILSRAILITSSAKIFSQIVPEINSQKRSLGRMEILSKSINKGLFLIKTPNISVSADLINKIAPEHLQLAVKNPKSIAKKINNTGLMLFGNYTPVALADFLGGTNHVLPTNGTAKSFSGLSILDYLKPIGTIQYSQKALQSVKTHIKAFAGIEGLDAHLKSVELRI